MEDPRRSNTTEDLQLDDGSKSSVEAGYVSCDELDDDSSLTSNDAGYNSSPDEGKNVTIGIDDQLSDCLQFIFAGLNVGIPPEYKVPNDQVPEWLDLEKFRAGQKFALDYLFGLNYSQMISLFILFSFEGSLQPLVYTDKSSTPYTAYRRYLSTVLRVKSWFEHDIWSEGNEGFQNIKTVRAMHLNVSKTLNNSPKKLLQEDLLLEGSTRHPNLWCPLHYKLKDYFESVCPAANSNVTLLTNKYNHNRLYFNQVEMSITQFGFFGLMIMYPEKFGAGSASREDLENYVHCWRGIGYLLGVKDEHNFCRGSFDEVKERCRDVIEYLVKPNFRNLSKDWEHMSRCVIEGISYYIPAVNFETALAYLCYVIGIDGRKFYSSLSWADYLMFNHLKFFMRYTLRIPGLRAITNRMVHKWLESAKFASPERHEFLKNKTYSYQNGNIITRL